MAPIDLSLAINYLPAVACILKTLLMSATLVFVKPEQALVGFSIFALGLNFDRVVSGHRIFDVNAVLSMILLSYFLNYLRNSMQSSTAATGAIIVFWSLFSSCLILEPTRLKGILAPDGWGETTRVDPTPSRWNLKRVLPHLINTIFMCTVVFTHISEETGSFKLARSLSFSILCVAWVYIVGVWQRCGHNNQAVFTQNLLARFCPLLFGPPLVTVGFMLVCVISLVYLYVELHGGGFKSWSGPASAQQDVQEACPMLERTVSYEEVGQTQTFKGRRLEGITEERHYWPGAHSDSESNTGFVDSQITEEPDEDLEACFQAACQARGQ
jgi:hypothetical protein